MQKNIEDGRKRGMPDVSERTDIFALDCEMVGDIDNKDMFPVLDLTSPFDE